MYEQHFGKPALDLAISYYCAAFDLGPSPDSTSDHVLLAFFRLERALLLRSQTLGGHGKALELAPRTHYLRPPLLVLRATSYSKRYRRTNEVADLNLAIEAHRAASDAFPDDHPQRLHGLLQYALSLQVRYTALKDAGDLDLAIEQLQVVLENCPGDLVISARRALAVALHCRYQRRQDDNDLELAIQTCALIVDPLPKTPQDTLFTCLTYATLLRIRFQRRGLLDDLNLAIHYFDGVVQGCPPGSQHHVEALLFYAQLLVIRSGQRESLVDIERAIEYLRTGVDVRSERDLSRSYLLATLGHTLFARFLHRGDVIDLEHAIDNGYEAVHSQPSGDDEARIFSINHLAVSLFARYQLQGDRTDVAHARTNFQQALELCPPGHSSRSWVLDSYARFLGRLSQEGDSDPEDLELCITYFYEALELCFEPSRSLILHNLATGDPFDIDVASSLCQTALELRPEARVRTLTDIEIALDTLHAAREAFSPGHPVLISTYRELSSDLEEAFKYRILATEYSSGGSQSQFEAAMNWVEDAEKFSHHSVLRAYRSAIRLLDLHLVLKPSVDLRHDIVKKQALQHDVVGAVEMFEQSRGLFWTHISRLRTPLDKLRAMWTDKFERLSRQLDVPSMTLGDDTEEGQRYRRAQRDWNDVVDSIRAVDGFNDFLLPPSYHDLKAAAAGGPVIILNASRHSCDAIIVLAHDNPVHISFSEDTFSKVLAMSSDFERLLRVLSRVTDTSGGGEARRKDERNLAGLLRRLWDTIVCDVVRGLEPHAPKGSRIWWWLSDLYVSSYTPTLSALIRSWNQRNAGRGAPLRFVSIGQPNSSGYEELLTVRKELDLVRECLPEAIQFTELSNETATRDAALAALRTHTFTHLACHGKQTRGQPFESHFAMQDGPLSLRDITATGDNDAPDEVIHLAAALQFAGIRNVVGTMRSVEDTVVVHIVRAFYCAMIGENGEFDPSRAARALRTATTSRVTRDNVPLDQRIVFIHIGA
ncbi:hypothetical protein BU15DRAFT_87712 [Melanogaster broomeanus]|nr:hypothetical protein BU15DRAFT_87712 [Melanogaster broomeanus]